MRHPDREAVARCPGCGGFFCRECVVEHDGRLLCARCLALAPPAGGDRRGRRRAARRAVAAVLGGLAAWLFFFWLGALLVRIPSAVHEGTVWQEVLDQAP